MEFSGLDVRDLRVHSDGGDICLVYLEPRPTGNSRKGIGHFDYTRGGTIRDCRFADIDVSGARDGFTGWIYLKGRSAAEDVRDVTFDGVRYFGEPVTASSPCVKIGGHVEGVRFLNGEFEAREPGARLVWHFGTPAKDRVTVTTNALERTADGWRFALPKADVPAGAWALDVIPEFMTARRGDEGWWMDGRGLYGRFDRVSGRNRWWRQQMPIYAVSRGGETWGAHVRTYRFHYDFTVRAAEGRYEVFPRFRFDRVREYFPLYQDLAIDFKRHPGGDRGYVSVAKEYRAYQFARGVRTIRERMRQYPDLKYLSEAMVIRLQTHGAKPIPEKPTDYTKETEPPINVYLPFDKATEFIEGIRAAGVREAAFVSAGWNKGGYDGQLPEHFPVEPVLGGEAGLRRMVSRAQVLGFMVMLHATYTEVYNVCPRFDENDIAKKADGSRVWNGLYFGGSCYWICERRSWEGWIADEMRRMRELGVSGNHYVDVFSATYPNCCADPRHPATAEEMAGYQNRILAEARSVFGGVSSEGGYDHVAANVDCINYVSTEMKKLHDGKTRGLELVDGVRPLWELVYHGTILYCPDRFTQNHTRGQNHAKKDESGNLDWLEGDGIVDPRTVLKMAEFGGRPIFYTYKPKDIPAIRRAYDDFQPLRHLQAELMEDHRELPSGLTVTVFANGEEVVCNYSDGVREYRGRSIRPLTYAILGPFHVDAKATDNFGDRPRTTLSLRGIPPVGGGGLSGGGAERPREVRDRTEPGSCGDVLDRKGG